MTIAEEIYSGHSAKEIGLTEVQYSSRKKTLDLFLDQWDRSGSFDSAYQVWLSERNKQIQSPVWTPEQESRGWGDVVAKATSAVGIKPCGGCKKRQEWMNKKLPYKRGK